nr:FAD-dependent oxidoreductase [Spiroplasma citri]
MDFAKVYYKSRYDQGDSKDYINCPMSKDEFELWVQALITAETVALHEFWKRNLFWRVYANWNNGKTGY